VESESISPVRAVDSSSSAFNRDGEDCQAVNHK
jgi:hypothetical protein